MTIHGHVLVLSCCLDTRPVEDPPGPGAWTTRLDPEPGGPAWTRSLEDPPGPGAWRTGTNRTNRSSTGAFTAGACLTKRKWPVSFPPEELKKRLTPIQYHVTQERGTESAFTGELTRHQGEGTYTCVVCGAPLFSSSSKFDSGSGWPSFFDILKEESIVQSDDFSYGMHRVETTCGQCGAHLGHTFDDGPKPTGKRYCINSASLAFQPKDAASSSAAEGGAASSSGGGDKTEL